MKMLKLQLKWYIKAQLGIILLPMGLCLFGESITRKVFQALGSGEDSWFWLGILSLICINAGIGLMIDSGLTQGYPRKNKIKN